MKTSVMIALIGATKAAMLVAQDEEIDTQLAQLKEDSNDVEMAEDSSDDDLAEDSSDDDLAEAEDSSDDELAEDSSDDELAEDSSDDELAEDSSDDELAENNWEDELAQELQNTDGTQLAENEFFGSIVRWGAKQAGSYLRRKVVPWAIRKAKGYAR